VDAGFNAGIVYKLLFRKLVKITVVLLIRKKKFQISHVVRL